MEPALYFGLQKADTATAKRNWFWEGSLGYALVDGAAGQAGNCFDVGEAENLVLHVTHFLLLPRMNTLLTRFAMLMLRFGSFLTGGDRT